MIIENGIGISMKGTVFISAQVSGDPNVKDPVDPLPVDYNMNPWAIWGNDNNLPKSMIADIESCGVLMAAIDGKARFGMGKGIRPYTIKGYSASGEEDLEPVNDPEIDDWLDDTNIFSQSFGLFKDIIALANYHVRLQFDNSGKKIGLIVRDDVSEMRYQKKDNKGAIYKTFLSAAWDRNPQKKDGTLVETPLLPDFGTVTYLKSISEKDRAGKSYAITGKIPGWGRHYYSMPTWYAAKKWVDIAKGVPAMKAAMFQNNIRLKYMVTIYDSYWERQFGEEWFTYAQEKKTELQAQVYHSIDTFLAGSDNAYKSVFVPGRFDPVTGKSFSDIEIKPIEDSTKPGELLPDSAAANSEILFALMMNPALMGADMPGGPYSGGAGSGSNIREAALVQVMIQEFERQQISRILNVVKKINGWDPNIVWRFPALVLTTLDTGKSTKPVTTG